MSEVDALLDRLATEREQEEHHRPAPTAGGPASESSDPIGPPEARRPSG